MRLRQLAFANLLFLAASGLIFGFLGNDVRAALKRSFKKIEEARNLPSSIKKSLESRGLRQFDRAHLVF